MRLKIDIDKKKKKKKAGASKPSRGQTRRELSSLQGSRNFFFEKANFYSPKRERERENKQKGEPDVTIVEYR